jgi:hypothetical protein
MTCTQVGWYQTAPASGSIRSQHLTLTAFANMCARMFPGVAWPPQTGAVNMDYGGVNIAGTNIIFTNGVEDPWRHASVPPQGPLAQPSESTTLINCSLCAHCVDLYTPTASDAPTLQQAREFTRSQFASWIKEFEGARARD